MKFKLPFLNRDKTDETDVPGEIQEYYQSEKRERVGVAWLLAGGTLVLTLLLAFGLFFGGRWVYQKIANRNNDEPTTAQTENNGDTPDETSDATQQQPSAGQSQTGTSSTTTTTPSTSNTGVAPATTSQPSTLPNTGPDGDY